MISSGMSSRQFILRVAASGLSMAAMDFLLNAGLFAEIWLRPSPFLVGPGELFRRLPLGYAAFLVRTVLFVWLTGAVGARTWKEGTLFGVKLGALLGLAAALGLRSATTASWTLLWAGWMAGELLLTTAACSVAGFASERGEKKALVSAIVMFIGAIVLITILQSAGLVPARRLG